MKLASYKGIRPGLPGVFNRVVRWWLHGDYSHCEVVFSDGMCFSCSKLDGGPRMKRITLDPARWDVIPVPGRYAEAQARARAEAICAKQGPGRIFYSLLLLAAFVIPPLRRYLRDNAEVCSTACAFVIGLGAHRSYDPNELHDAIAAGQ